MAVPKVRAKRLDLAQPFRLWVGDMDLDALAIFHSVAMHGGFGRAARATGAAKTTLSRRVAELERQLGARLFERASGVPRLTDEGRALLAGTREPLDELAAAEELLRGGGEEPRGRLRVSVPLMVGQQVMGGLAARFLARYPLVRLEVVADDRYVDLVQEGFDVAVRARPDPGEELVGRCVLRDPLLAVASPELARPGPTAAGSLVRVPAVTRALGRDGGPWLLQDGDHPLMLDPDPVLRLSTLAIRDAVIAGAGVALFPAFFVRGDLDAGRLVSWGTLAGDPLEFWALHASGRLASAKVRAITAALAEAFASDGDWLLSW